METNWMEYLDKLIEKYGKRKHPLDYKSRYQLLIMVILSAQDSDKHINEIGPAFFKAFPSINTLVNATSEDLFPYLNTVRNFGNKIGWILKLGQLIGDNDKIPVTLDALTKLPGIGRKSANVIMRESGVKSEGVIVDLHVVRVGPRIGIASGTQPEKIEKQIMNIVPEDKWGEIGMALSFLGREICRPTNPKCELCVMNKVCHFYNATSLNNNINTSDPTLF